MQSRFYPLDPTAASNFGIGLGNGLAKGMEMALQEQRAERAEEKAKKRAEEERYIALRNQLYIEKMLETYTPARHQEFVSCIWRSELPKDQKLLIANHFEKIKKGVKQ